MKKTNATRKNTATAKDESLLVSFARTIGSTLGTVVAKTGGPSKPTRRRSGIKRSGPNLRKTRGKIGT
jgi:hypothetical protein